MQIMKSSCKGSHDCKGMMKKKESKEKEKESMMDKRKKMAAPAKKGKK